MHIVLIETTAPRGFEIVGEMADAGIEVTFVAQDMKRHMAQNNPALLERAARLVEVPELGQAGDLAALLRHRWGPHTPDGVICRKEIFARDVAQLTTALGLRGESPSTARLLSDKSAVRECLSRANLGSLKWRRVTGVDEALRAAIDIGYPMVVKPVSGYYSLAVNVVEDESALIAALSEVVEAAASQAGAQPVMLLEEFAPGILVSAELLVQDGEPLLLGFSQRDACPLGVTAELGGHFPARLTCMNEARQFAEAVVRAVGIRNSAVHMELMLTPGGPELVEVNGRVAGHVVMPQISHALGRSIAMDLVALATGHPLSPLSDSVATVALRQLWSDHAGTVVSLPHLQSLDIEALSYGLLVREGDHVRKLRSNPDRFGYVLAEGRDPQEATDNAGRAAQALLAQIVIAPDDGSPARALAQSRQRSAMATPE